MEKRERGMKVLAINANLKMVRGTTALILEPFVSRRLLPLEMLAR